MQLELISLVSKVSFTWKLLSNQDYGRSTVGLLALTLECRNVHMVLAKVLTSQKREKVTAKADALRAVIEKTKKQ